MCVCNALGTNQGKSFRSVPILPIVTVLFYLHGTCMYSCRLCIYNSHKYKCKFPHLQLHTHIPIPCLLLLHVDQIERGFILSCLYIYKSLIVSTLDISAALVENGIKCRKSDFAI